jgi:antitoxin YefM
VTITANEARKVFSLLVKKVSAGSEPSVITSDKGNAVLISEAEFNTLSEMQHLFSTSANRAWLAESMDQAARGETRSLDRIFSEM